MSLNRIAIRFFEKKIDIDGLLIVDQHQKTLAKIDHLDAKIKSLSLSHLNFSRINLQRADVNLRIYKSDSVLNLDPIIEYFSGSGGGETPKFTVRCDLFSMRKSHFAYQDQNYMYSDNPSYLDYDDLDFKNLGIRAEKISIDEKFIIADIRKLTFTERSGINVKKFAAFVTASSDSVFVRRGYLQTAQSSVDFDVDLIHKSWADYLDFISNVQMKGNIHKARLAFTDLFYFAPQLDGMDATLAVNNANFKGTVDNLSVRNFDISTLHSTHFAGNIKLKGLPDIEKTYIEYEIADISTTRDDINAFKLPEGENIVLPEMLKNLGRIKVEGTYIGVWDDFHLNAEFLTDLGNFQSNFTMQRDSNARLSYDGNVSGNSADIGLLLSLKQNFQIENFSANLHGKGIELKTANMQFDFDVSHLAYQSYDFERFHLDGNMSGGKINATLNVANKSDSAYIHANLDLSKKDIALIADAQLYNINLGKLELTKDTSDLLTARISAHIDQLNLQKFAGSVHISKTKLNTADATYLMNSLLVKSYQTDSTQRETTIKSDFFDAVLQGHYNFTNFGEIVEDFNDFYLSNLSNKNKVPIVFQGKKTTKQPYDLHLNMDLWRTDGIVAYFIPKLNVSNGSNFTADFTVAENTIEVNFSGKSQKISFQGYDFSNWYINGITDSGTLYIQTGSEYLASSDSALILFDPLFKVDAFSNHINWDIAWGNSQDSTSDAHFNGFFAVHNPRLFELHITDVDLSIYQQQWEDVHESSILFDNGKIRFNNLSFIDKSSGSKREIAINGIVSKNSGDILEVSLSNVDLEALAFFTSQTGMDFAGVINGNVNFHEMLTSPYFVSNLIIKNFGVNGKTYGNGTLEATYEQDLDRIRCSFTINEAASSEFRTVTLRGFYFPRAKEKQLDFRVALADLDLSILKNYVSAFSSSLTGKASGTFTLKGNFQNPDVNGEISATEGRLYVDFTNTAYLINRSKIKVNLKEISFTEMELTDELKGTKGSLTGKIKHDMFNDIRLDIAIKANNLLALNTEKIHNDLFYGQAYATGTMKITGPLDDILIDIDVKSEKGTIITIPFNDKVSISDNNFIAFEKRVDSSGYLAQNIVKKTENSGLGIKVRLNVTPDASIVIDMVSQNSGGILKAKGNGDLRMEITTANDFYMFGTYTIDEGTYDFNLQNLAMKRFEILKNGNITWAGDPYTGKLNIEAIYNTRTSLYPVLAGTAAVAVEDDDKLKRKTSVQSIIQLTGSMSNPEIHFDIDLPNADQEIKEIFFTYVNKNDENEMLKQSFSLLVFNMFMPAGNNSVSATSMLSSGAKSSTFDLISSQLTALIDKVGNLNMDLGVSYSPASDVSDNSQLQVTFAKQFGNKWSVEGNVGYANNTSTNQNNFVGEFNAEYRLSERWRFRAFNRSNENDPLNAISESSSAYTQGISAAYRREFDKVMDLFNPPKKIKISDEHDNDTIQ